MALDGRPWTSKERAWLQAASQLLTSADYNNKKARKLLVGSRFRTGRELLEEYGEKASDQTRA